MKKLRRGFTLIELLVVIAIIGILATTVAPKLREQLAKAKDSKAIALLGAARTAAGVALVDGLVQSDGGAVTLYADDVISKLDSSSQDLITSGGAIAIGGRKAAISDASLIYGGNVYISDGSTVLKKDDRVAPLSASEDSIELYLTINSGATTGTALSTEGKEWSSY